ncbi:MAG: ABC transporter ATP-binding protein/permease [Chitinophagales bacterium]|nr:ABC transporter ATP-binding protein/permease [Chitinophagales bacterium]
MEGVNISTNQKGDVKTLRKVLRLARPFRSLFIFSFALGVLVAAISTIRPYLIKIIVDDQILNRNYSGILKWSIISLVFLVLEFLSRYGFGYISGILGQSVIKDLRVKVFNHVKRLNLRYFDQTPIGTITTRTINDVEAINNIFSEGIITLTTDILTLIAVFSLMFYLNWKLTLVSLIPFPFIILATYVFKEAVKSSFHEVREKVAQMNAFVQEHLTGMRIVQVFNAEQQEQEKFEQINIEHRDANLKSVWYFSIFFPVVEIILALSIGLMVWYGAVLSLKYNGKPGDIIAFLMYLNLAFRPLRMMADKFNTLQMGLIAAERVFKLIETEDKLEKTGTIQKTAIQGDIEFKHVWFAYDQENYVLKDISFKVNSGETIALVGATGSGKSSTINILSRFYEIQRGEILLDGIDLKNYTLESLRKGIAVVLQDVFLFSGTVMDNITLNDPNISEETVLKTAQLVGADEFILNLPGGFNYPVMERGATLSVGQRQLISFIRALVYNPKILVLDEATSSVDTESEQLIQRAIEVMVKGRTSLVIAHRLSTIQNAHKIIVMDKGEIKEMGTHEELLAKEDGLYQKLHAMQFQGT